MKVNLFGGTVPACGLLAAALMLPFVSDHSAQSIEIDEANACGTGVTDPTVTLNATPATTGGYTLSPDVTKVSDEDDNPDNGLEVNPKVYGGKVNNHVIPNETHSDETRNVTVDYHDSGKTDLEFDLKLRFEEVDGQDYTITWNNHEFAAKWKGQISLPKEEANGSAKWRAWTFHPWDPTAGDGAPTAKQTQVAVPLKAIVPNVPAVTEWEYTRNSNPAADGPGVTPINEPGEMAVFADPQQGGAIQGLATEFSYTGTGTGWKTVTYKTAITVKLEHNIHAGYSQVGSVYTSESTGVDPDLPDRDGWQIYGWKLSVEITSP